MYPAEGNGCLSSFLRQQEIFLQVEVEKATRCSLCNTFQWKILELRMIMMERTALENMYVYYKSWGRDNVATLQWDLFTEKKILNYIV